MLRFKGWLVETPRTVGPLESRVARLRLSGRKNNFPNRTEPNRTDKFSKKYPEPKRFLPGLFSLPRGERAWNGSPLAGGPELDQAAHDTWAFGESVFNTDVRSAQVRAYDDRAVLKRWKSLQKSLWPVVICPYLCSSEGGGGYLCTCDRWLATHQSTLVSEGISMGWDGGFGRWDGQDFLVAIQRHLTISLFWCSYHTHLVSLPAFAHVQQDTTTGIRISTRITNADLRGVMARTELSLVLATWACSDGR